MQLYFLRHGRADRSAWSGNDHDRPLTENGKERMRRQALAIADMGLPIQTILTSPLTRAFQTAEIVAQQLGMEAFLETDDRISPGFFLEDLQSILEDRWGMEGLMLVGHEPDFSELISDLTGGEVLVKKGSLIRVDVDYVSALSGILVFSLPAGVQLRMEH